MGMRKFIVGAYWGGLLAVALGLLPILVFRPRLLPMASMEELQQLTPIVLLAGFALLTSVLAAGTMVILREIAAVRAALEKVGTMPAELPARLSNWAGRAQGGGTGGKATISCNACGRTNWNDAFSCLDCGAPLACDGPAPAR
jgi:hypothetical protein